MRGVLDYVGSTLDFEAIRTPILAMCGENEPWIDTHATYFGQRLTACQVRQIPGASHNSHVVNPEYVHNAIIEFLSAIDMENRYPSLLRSAIE